MKTRHWVFGYGSLIWKQDFPFIEARPASVEGWARRFWQGSHDHRGVPEDPGRVLTLTSLPGAVCHGRAFLIETDVFEHLDHREKNGYERLDLTIRFARDVTQGVTYVAPHDNHAFLGEAPLDEMVEQILRSEGPSGRNVDYVLELAAALRDLSIEDPHVFEIERALLERAGGRD
jgi:cation transport protein ChaC